MLINKNLRLGSPFGPVVQVVEDSGGRVSLLTAIEIEAGTILYEEDGTPALTTGIKSTDKLATFYESRTEQQVIDEDDPGSRDYGWRAKHLGWVVKFNHGTALFGKLAAVNQNRQNVGIEGPTSTAGTNGSPAGLFQKVNVSNRPSQVNGWKSFDSPGAYVLDPADVQQLDTTFVYADAFVSWNSDNGTVVAPGSDMNGLVEYSPTNSIVYTPFP